MVSKIRFIENKQFLKKIGYRYTADVNVSPKEIRFFHDGKSISFIEAMAVIAHEEAHDIVDKLEKHPYAREVGAWWIAEIKLERYFGSEWHKYVKKFLSLQKKSLNSYKEFRNAKKK